MGKIKGTAEEISKEIQRRIRNSKELDGDCMGCRTATPRRTDPATNGGCNWTVDGFPDVIPGCLDFVCVDFVNAITRKVMAVYELRE